MSKAVHPFFACKVTSAPIDNKNIATFFLLRKKVNLLSVNVNFYINKLINKKVNMVIGIRL